MSGSVVHVPFIYVRCGTLDATCWEAQGTGLIVVQDMMAEADSHAQQGHYIHASVTWLARTQDSGGDVL